MTPAEREEARARTRSRRGEGDLLRDEILTVADRLLIETGSQDAVSIRSVADAVGVTPPSIYRHFPDKTQLMFSVCLASFERFASVMQAALSHDDPVENMRSLCRAYVQYGIDHPEHYRIMFMGRYELTDEQMMDEMVSSTSSFGILLDTTRALIDAGVLRPDLAALGELYIGFLLWSSVHGITSLLVAKPSLPWPDREQLVGQQCDVILHGMLARPA